MKKFILITFLLCFVFLATSRKIAFAEGGIAWDPQGKPICIKGGDQRNIRMVPDGSGGAIIVWEDYRRGEPDIYAQKINGIGDRLWGDEYGVAVCTASYGQKNPVIVGDGSGGAIIAWEDYRGAYPAIYAVRISSAGSTHLSWPVNGRVLKLTSTDNQSFPDIVSDGFGGAIIVWQEFNGSQYSIYAHGINGDGSNMWGGVPVSTGTEPKEHPKIINDGTGYVITTWQDKRSGSDYDIYAQRMDIGTGSTSWIPNGEPVSTVPAFDQKNPEIVVDGLGGAIITWTDYRSGDGDIYVQRISTAGAQMWDNNGIAICKEVNEQSNPFIMNDLQAGATTGAIIAWEDMRSGDSDIYAVKVGTDNLSIQSGYAKLMAGWLGDQVAPRMVTDNQGGGIIAWIGKDLISEGYKIFVSRRNQDGDPVWISPQVQVCQASNIIEHQMVSDNSGGVIIAWVGGTAGDYNIYAQRVFESSTLPPALISGVVVTLKLEEIMEGKIETIEGVTGVEVEALTDNKLAFRDFTDNGLYQLSGLSPGTIYEVRATWSANDIVTSVSLQSKAPNYMLCFILEEYYILGGVQGIISGVEKKNIASSSSLKSKGMSGSALKKILSPGNGIAFVELEQRGKVIVRVPVEIDGSYSIPNLLPGRFIARAYNGTIYSKPRTVNLKEGETLKVNFAFGIMPGETVFNYPNPAKNGSTTIRYNCGYTDPEAEIKIYNINGELVREVKDSEIDETDAPIYKFLWDCKNSPGKEVASGVYIYIVEVKDKDSNESKKVVKRLAVIK